MPDVPVRSEMMDRLLAAAGWGEALRHPLPGDASARRYIRLTQHGASRMLVDAPPGREDLGKYLRLNRHLASLGLRVPAIHAVDEASGFALIEDFGDATFTRLLAAGEAEASLYDRATDVLVRLQQAPGATDVVAPPYDDELLLEEAGRCALWYLPLVLGRDLTASERADFDAVWRRTLGDIRDCRDVLVYRDFHVDNLMIVDGPNGPEVGLLDFQDAVIGHPAYDLASLIEDARRDLAPATRERVLARYRAAMDVGADELAEKVAILGAQRHTKILGLFVRLSRRDGKHGYLPHIPRLQRQLAGALQHPALSGVARMMREIAPGYESISVTPPSGS